VHPEGEPTHSADGSKVFDIIDSTGYGLGQHAGSSVPQLLGAAPGLMGSDWIARVGARAAEAGRSSA
jgi:hypothetical protein